MSFLSKLFGGSKPSVSDLLHRNAVIVDVRTPGEFAGGHIKKSKNIPLNTISGKVNDLKKLDRPVVLCCASGMRSGQATRILRNQGIECANGGSWASLQSKV